MNEVFLQETADLLMTQIQYMSKNTVFLVEQLR